MAYFRRCFLAAEGAAGDCPCRPAMVSLAVAECPRADLAMLWPRLGGDRQIPHEVPRRSHTAELLASSASGGSSFDVIERRNALMRSDLAALTPPLVMALAFIAGLVALLRREMAPRRRGHKAPVQGEDLPVGTDSTAASAGYHEMQAVRRSACAAERSTERSPDNSGELVAACPDPDLVGRADAATSGSMYQECDTPPPGGASVPANEASSLVSPEGASLRLREHHPDITDDGSTATSL